MIDALKGLLHTPQNNFAIYKVIQRYNVNKFENITKFDD